MVSFGTAALTALVLAATPAAVARHRDTAQVWITSPDGVYRMADLGTVRFGQVADTALPLIEIDPHQKFQTMTGFGASITDSSAAVLYRLAPATRNAAM